MEATKMVLRRRALPALVCVLGSFLWQGTASAASPPASDVRVYTVDRTVAEFPHVKDLSTPEAAYAAFIRVMVTGDPMRWGELCARELRTRVLARPPRAGPMAPDRAEAFLNARIVEVHVLQGTHAQIIAQMPESYRGGGFRNRGFALEDGRWLNAGENAFKTLEEARSDCARLLARRRSLQEQEAVPATPDPLDAIGDHDAYLRRFTDFLQAHAEDPKPFVLRALAEHRVVIMGEVHHRPRYWAFNSSLVADPLFAERVGVVYMELPSNGQALVDQFLAAEELDVAPVIEMLRDMLWMGWPDQAMLDFFKAVWTASRSLPPGKRIRIVLADMQRPWKEIRERGDWAAYEVDRDRFMAQSVLDDLKQHPEETRHALFIVGVGHAMLGLTPATGLRREGAGSHLRRELGADEVFAIFPHMPVQTNVGEVHGRLRHGLFESAFAALGNRPMAFPLDSGPFGEQPFDAMPDARRSGTYRDGYSAYLYLGPLEDEVFSPLIPGFYTDEFVQELERRTRIMNGKPWSEIFGRDPNAGEFIAWMGNSWGRPRAKWRDGLGPIDAWRNPKQAASPAEPERALKGTKEELQALVADFYRHNARDITSRTPIRWGDVQTDVEGDYSIQYVFVGTVWNGAPLLFNPVFTFDRTGSIVRIQEGDIQGTTEALKALVESHLAQGEDGVAARTPGEWDEFQKDADGNYSIRHRCEATMDDGTKRALDQVFVFDRTGKLLRVTDGGAPGV